MSLSSSRMAGLTENDCGSTKKDDVMITVIGNGQHSVPREGPVAKPRQVSRRLMALSALPFGSLSAIRGQRDAICAFCRAI